MLGFLRHDWVDVIYILRNEEFLLPQEKDGDMKWIV